MASTHDLAVGDYASLNDGSSPENPRRLTRPVYFGAVIFLVGIAGLATILTVTYSNYAPDGVIFPAPTSLKHANELLVNLPQLEPEKLYEMHVSPHIIKLYTLFLASFGSTAPNLVDGVLSNTKVHKLSREDFQQRLSVFAGTIKEIIKLNMQTYGQVHRATFAITLFADWTPDELQRLFSDNRVEDSEYGKPNELSEIPPPKCDYPGGLCCSYCPSSKFSSSYPSPGSCVKRYAHAPWKYYSWEMDPGGFINYTEGDLADETANGAEQCSASAPLRLVVPTGPDWGFAPGRACWSKCPPGCDEGCNYGWEGCPPCNDDCKFCPDQQYLDQGKCSTESSLSMEFYCPDPMFPYIKPNKDYPKPSNPRHDGTECRGRFCCYGDDFCRAEAVQPFPANRRRRSGPDPFGFRNWATTYPKVFQPRQQGACGSCWAHSAAAELRQRYAIGHGGEDLGKLSVQYLIDCMYPTKTCSDGVKGCCGGWTPDAFNWVQKQGGIPTQASYGSPQSGSDPKIAHPCRHVAPAVTTAGADMLSTEEEMAKAIYNEGPLAVGVYAGSSWFNYHGGVLQAEQCKSPGFITNHAVQCVGYDSRVGAWIVMNSWGKSWGVTAAYPHSPSSSDGGFILLAVGTNTCNIVKHPTIAINVEAV